MTKIMLKKRLTSIWILSMLVLASCSTSQAANGATQASGKLKVVATNSIVADVVRQVGGNAIDLSQLLPLGSDPHSFEPSPQDVAKVADADVVFMNGVGLEEFMQPLLENAAGKARLVSVSEKIPLLELDPSAVALEAEEHPGEAHTGAEHQSDPHVWMDPNNVIVWSQNIAATLSELDAANAETYQANAEKYQQELKDLDAWVQQQVAQIPAENRKIVTDHVVFGYFSRRYGFTQVGAVVPGYSTMAEPSAKELANLEDMIRKLGVKAIVVGKTVNPALAQRVAEDTNTQLVFVYTGSLSESGGPADNYLNFIKYNVEVLVSALK